MFQDMGSLAPPKSYLACQISHSCAMLVFWPHTSKNLVLFLSGSVLKSICKENQNPKQTPKKPPQNKQTKIKPTKTTKKTQPNKKTPHYYVYYYAGQQIQTKTKTAVFRNHL